MEPYLNDTEEGLESTLLSIGREALSSALQGASASKMDALSKEFYCCISELSAMRNGEPARYAVFLDIRDARPLRICHSKEWADFDVDHLSYRARHGFSIVRNEDGSIDRDATIEQDNAHATAIDEYRAKGRLRKRFSRSNPDQSMPCYAAICDLDTATWEGPGVEFLAERKHIVKPRAVK